VTKAKPDAAALARTQKELADRIAELVAAEATNEALRLAIAELSASRAALAASEAKLRLALEAARMATWDWDAESDRTLGSAGREALYGRRPGMLPTLSVVLGTVHPEDRERAEATIHRALHRRPGEEEFDAVEYRIITPDAQIRWLRSQGRVTERDPATGRPLRAAGVTFDITERREAEEAAERRRAAIHAIYDSVPVGLALVDHQGQVVCMNARLGAILGVPAGAQPAKRGLRDLVPASVVETVDKAFRRVIAEAKPVTGLELACETAAAPGDPRHWVANLQPIPRESEGKGEVASVSLMLEDVTERRRAEARRDLLAREVDHRARNALAVVQAAVRLTRAPDSATFAEAVEGRIAAMARAQTLLAESHWKGAGLCALLEGALSAFLAMEGAEERAWLEGPAATLSPAATQPLSMAMHELATNATKYGALSAPGGKVRVTWRIDGEAGLLRLRWEETGGPRIEAAPARRGFGSRVIDATIRDQLGGTVRRFWKETGLVCELALPLARSLAGNGGRSKVPGAEAPPATGRSRPARPGADPPAATRADG